MNKKLTFTGGEPDITESNLLRDSEANRHCIHGRASGLSGGNDYIIQGCVFTKNVGTDASITDGYAFYNGEVVMVEAQTIPETLGSNLWELQKSVTYDSAGDKTYKDGTFRQTYQDNRMVLANVLAITAFDIEEADKIGERYKLELTADNTNPANYGITLSGSSIVEYNYLIGQSYQVTGVLSFLVTSVPGATLGAGVKININKDIANKWASGVFIFLQRAGLIIEANILGEIHLGTSENTIWVNSIEPLILGKIYEVRFSLIS